MKFTGWATKVALRVIGSETSHWFKGSCVNIVNHVCCRSGLAFSPATSFASGLLSSPILAMSPFTALSKSSVNSVAQAFKTHSRAKAGLQPTKHSLKTRGLEPAPEESWQAPGHVPPTPSPAPPYARPSGQPSPPQQQPRKRSGWLAQSLLPGCSWPGAPADVPWSPE